MTKIFQRSLCGHRAGSDEQFVKQTLKSIFDGRREETRESAIINSLFLMDNSSVYFTTFLKIDSNVIKTVFDEFEMSRRKFEHILLKDFRVI